MEIPDTVILDSILRRISNPIIDAMTQLFAAQQKVIQKMSDDISGSLDSLGKTIDNLKVEVAGLKNREDARNTMIDTLQAELAAIHAAPAVDVAGIKARIATLNQSITDQTAIIGQMDANSPLPAPSGSTGNLPGANPTPGAGDTGGTAQTPGATPPEGVPVAG